MLKLHTVPEFIYVIIYLSAMRKLWNICSGILFSDISISSTKRFQSLEDTKMRKLEFKKLLFHLVSLFQTRTVPHWIWELQIRELTFLHENNSSKKKQLIHCFSTCFPSNNDADGMEWLWNLGIICNFFCISI